ncbi:hypothetical protein H6S82_04315 [Planktothrix sp. FACHB-1355]|uniref:Uncharacterized protein n=1 Tax=Aerosakkonema funiforme FACHB-1375 TaxID=2949571 RepID=A0A926ZHP9_9CYAN|nr:MULTISPECIES: hypothetical protein [Oscillatoriales]MBD2182859.1 hypothetical protein [Aerosakkonema funiforme FACHB-1375]MBD3558079.1 hypothetical protein [Planktothrix sp. FACHB-1355]
MISFYNLIQKIKQRPSLYLGKRSSGHLQVFLDGYTFARRELDVPLTEEERDFEDFQEWIEKRFNQPSTQSWERIILFYSEDERDALDKFFDLFEDFKNRHQKLEIDEIAKAEDREGDKNRSRLGASRTS